MCPSDSRWRDGEDEWYDEAAWQWQPWWSSGWAGDPGLGIVLGGHHGMGGRLLISMGVGPDNKVVLVMVMVNMFHILRPFQFLTYMD